MSTVTVSQLIDSTPDHVWSLVGQPQSLASWHPAIAESRVSEDGSRRTCVLADGAKVEELITARDETTRAYTYRIVESPLPLTDYVSTLRVVAKGSGAEVTWESAFEPAGVPAEELEGMIRGLYEAGLSELAARFRR